MTNGSVGRKYYFDLSGKQSTLAIDFVSNKFCFTEFANRYSTIIGPW